MENQIQNPTTESIFDEMKPLPVYYSENAIFGFSVLCSTMFGAVLMAMNLSRTQSKKGVWPTIILGIGITVLQFVASSYLPQQSSSGTWFFGFLGGFILKKFFWEKYIGEKVPYTKRAILVPAIIAVVLIGVVVAAILATV